MDFLDPKRKRAHRRRLKIGYGLMAVLVLMATVIGFYLAYGYNIDPSTGDVYRSGIVFVDSKPQGARIFLDDKPQGTTSTRLVLPAGVYTVRVELEGYRHWQRTFTLEGGELERLVYPKLIPNNLVTTDVVQYDVTPGLATQSPDRRWVLVQKPAQQYQFDVFDLNTINKPPTSIIMPPQLLTDPGDKDAQIKLVEWSTDNRHVLFVREYGNKKTEYIMLDRERPDESININKTLGITPVVVSLRNKHGDRLYFVEGKARVLRSANLDAQTISAPITDGVVDYRSYGDDLILAVSEEKFTSKDRATFSIFESGTRYTLRDSKKSDRYVLDISRYDNKYYYAVGSSAEDITYIYSNPLEALKPDPKHSLTVTMMPLSNPRFVSFSANTQFVSVQSGANLLVLDLEDEEQYRSMLEQDIALDYKLEWMDGHRFMYVVNQQSYVVDFDGSNLQTLVTSRLAPGPFFDRDYDNVYTFEESKNDGGKKALTATVIDSD